MAVMAASITHRFYILIPLGFATCPVGWILLSLQPLIELDFNPIHHYTKVTTDNGHFAAWKARFKEFFFSAVGEVAADVQDGQGQ